MLYALIFVFIYFIWWISSRLFIGYFAADYLLDKDPVTNTFELVLAIPFIGDIFMILFFFGFVIDRFKINAAFNSLLIKIQKINLSPITLGRKIYRKFHKSVARMRLKC